MSRRKHTSRSKRTAEQSKRIRTVWLSFLGCMTLVGGVLLLVESPQAAASGLTLPPAAQLSSGSSGFEPVFEVAKNRLVPGRWKAIVIHHSGKPTGNGESIRAEHREAGLADLGHHFIIGNGRGGMEAGEIFLGDRWRSQESGVHAKGSKADWYNQNALSICLVGDGDRKPFDQLQLERTAELIEALCKRLGIPPSAVVLQRDLAKVSDPGRTFPEAWLRERLGR